MNKKLIWCLTTMLCLILVSFIIQKKALAYDIKIATVNVTPRGYINHLGDHAGGSYDVVNLIADKAGFTYKNELLPVPRIVKGLELGTTDLALLVPNQHINTIATPLAYIRDVNFIVIGRKGTDITKKQALQGTKVAHLRQATAASNLLKDIELTLIPANNYKQLIKLLLSQRIDYIVGPKANIYWALKELNQPTNVLGQPLSLKKLEMHLYYSKKSADKSKMAALVAATEQLHENNKINETLAKYDYSTTN